MALIKQSWKVGCGVEMTTTCAINVMCLVMVHLKLHTMLASSSVPFVTRDTEHAIHAPTTDVGGTSQGGPQNHPDFSNNSTNMKGHIWFEEVHEFDPENATRKR